MWKDICLSNRDNLLTMLDMFADRAVRCGSWWKLRLMPRGCWLTLRPREVRQQVPLRGKGLLPLLYNLFVFVPDRPGLIGEVTGLLGEGGINIAEIELLRVREKTGGPLRLGFVTAAARDAAAEILQTAGLRVERQEE